MFAMFQQYRLALYAIAVGTLMALSAAGAWSWQANVYGRQIATMQAEQAHSLAAAQAQARAEEQRRQPALEVIRRDAQDHIATAAADAAAADTAADSLRDQVAKLARRPTSCAGVAAGGQTADPAKLLLADVLSRIDARAGELAAYADRARIAGEVCERSFNAVKKGG